MKIGKKALEYGVYIAVAIFIYTKLNGNIRELEEIDDVDIGLMVLSLWIFSLHSIWNGFNWHYLIRQSGEKVEISGQMKVYLKSYILRYIPGNVVGIMSRGVYNKQYKVPMVKSLWGWFFENIVYLMWGILIGGYFLITSGFSIAQISALVIASLIIGSVVLLRNEWFTFLFNKVVLPKLPPEAKSEFKSLNVSFSSRIQLFGRYLVSWIIYSVSFLILAMAFGVDVSKNWLLLVSANALSWSIGYLSLVTPSGTGVRESVMITALSGGAGLSNEIAVIISIAARIVFIVGELLGFAQAYAMMFISDFFYKKNE
ncbi:flippase-like domain-containing protein [Candidatus Dojkabacteria bacterium]|uniref:Flippase-like domain-containing protein n=1 Tax=Candidatus Dojkabacteria bacterium TaxID=2099670 RepID=A0A955HZF7_9BACT|nr:flippase-like domain-containing protein [Candidatus Dojkabacteria bacterium]MCB9790565.1 flippase-like domain-containing protein [Candidatus Nomurabacteria bacterium]